MALDVGSKRIGLAIADPNGTYALPVGVIARTTLRDDLQRIAEYVESHGVVELVVGEPLNLKGERAVASLRMDEFVEALQRVFPGPIHRIDERMTTAQAHKSMIAGGVSRRQRRESVDALAAALILDTYLARRAR